MLLGLRPGVKATAVGTEHLLLFEEKASLEPPGQVVQRRPRGMGI
jgi:hypothetical protein